MASASAAPVYKIPSRKVVAVEHPLVVKNLENGLKTFGKNQPFERLIDTSDPDSCIPLYLRHNDPMCVPVLSYNTPTNNVLLKITVPKRIGRKRKRGALDPSLYNDTGFSSLSDTGPTSSTDSIGSQSRKDKPAELLRTLKDNASNYSIEAVAEITNTHRFREFFTRFQDTVLTGKMEKIKEFRLDPSRGLKPNDQIMPPPRLSHHSVPFNWEWQQNPNNYTDVDPETGNPVLKSRAPHRYLRVDYLSHDVAKIPDKGPEVPSGDPNLQSLVAILKEALEERPIWTRRALVNRLGQSPHLSLLKSAYQYVSYQFKNGPWREALVKYGVDPRSDPKYRIYQTIFFRISDDVEPGVLWKDQRREQMLRYVRTDPTSHLFDGKHVSLEGRVWQICDITDPLLYRLARDAPYPREFSSKIDGWFQNGRFAKIKAIMKTKLIAIRLGKPLTDQDFAIALSLPDAVAKSSSRRVYVPVPDLRLTAAEFEALTKAGLVKPLSQKQILKKAKKDSDGSGGAKPLVSKSNQRYVQSLWDMSEQAAPETPDSRALEAVTQMNGMGMLDQGPPGLNSDVYGRVARGVLDDDLADEDEDEDEDEDDEDDEPERESGSEEEEDEDA
ncbi:Transcription factor tau subunit [Lachnellula occidentalis]|uniref:Transcription factor tau subunit n=1 Tax=Lachnellula occidentalis TaxID=215460 RepID=A0A8H8RY92_9HELO|nr:Transcription factor tau subunit [Lachnellula occidentalis]